MYIIIRYIISINNGTSMFMVIYPKISHYIPMISSVWLLFYQGKNP